MCRNDEDDDWTSGDEEREGDEAGGAGDEDGEATEAHYKAEFMKEQRKLDELMELLNETGRLAVEQSKKAGTVGLVLKCILLVEPMGDVDSAKVDEFIAQMKNRNQE